MTRIPFALALLAAGSACVSTQDAPHDPAQRKPLLDALKSLEGTWEQKDEKGEAMLCEFKVTAAGSAVREIMFPGTAQEMTNLYSLDGNGLAMVHYCAMGNQPRMRATARVGKNMAFGLVSVCDMESPEEPYMGEMTLEFVDQDHIVEHWRTYVKDVLQKDEGVDITLARRK